MATLESIFKLTDRYSKTIRNVEKSTTSATDKILKASKSTDDFNNKLNNTSRSADSASGGIRKLIGAVVSLKAVQKGMSIVDEYTNTKARLSLINDELQTQAELQDKIFQAASRSRGEYTEMASAVSKMGLLAGNAFTSNDELIGFTELVQKSFKVGGADTSEQMGAMRQLTQAMASGRLQGDEMVSIMENAPLIYQAIEKYMGLAEGELKALSSEGVVSADIMKNAMFMAADDINSKFAQMPMTFGDIWTKIKNGALQAFIPLMDGINNLINTEAFNVFVNGLIAGLYLIASVAGGVINVVAAIASAFSDNWSWIAPIVWGAIWALIAYNAVLGIGWLLTLKDIAVKLWNIAVTVAKTVADWLATAAIIAMTAAQEGLNAAMMLMPITWIIIGIIILIALFYAAVAVVNHFAGTSISATGLIAGAFMALGAFILNQIIYMANLFISIAEFFVNVWQNPIYSVKKLFANLVTNVLDMAISMTKGFDSVATNIANAFVKGANMAIGAINWIIDALNKVPGIDIGKMGEMKATSSITSTLEGIEGNINDWVGPAPDNYKSLDKFDMVDIGGAFDTGYNAGKNFADNFSIGNILDNVMGDITGGLGGINPEQFLVDESATTGGGGAGGGGLGSKGNPTTVKGTGSGEKVEVDISDQDLKYLRDIAERDYINKFSTATLAPNIQVSFGDVHEEADANKLAGRIQKILEEEIAIVAEGAY